MFLLYAIFSVIVLVIVGALTKRHEQQQTTNPTSWL